MVDQSLGFATNTHEQVEDTTTLVKVIMEIVFIQMITDGLSDMLGLHWDFHSLLLAIQMMFSFMLVDETSSLKLCPNCYKAFFTENEEDVYCSKECKIKDK